MLVAPRMPRDRVYNEMQEPLLGERGGQDDVVPFSVGDTVELYRLRTNIHTECAARSKGSFRVKAYT